MENIGEKLSNVTTLTWVACGASHVGDWTLAYTGWPPKSKPQTFVHVFSSQIFTDFGNFSPAQCVEICNKVVTKYSTTR